MTLRGALRPRVELRPAAVDTMAPEVVALAAQAGLEPEPWQAEGLDIMMSLRPDGLWAARDYAEIVGRQQGKSSGLGIPRVLAGLFLLPERLLMWSAHEYKTAIESFLQVKDALLRLGEETRPNVIEIDDGGSGILIKVNNTNGEEGFELTSRPTDEPPIRKRLRFLARSKGSGRGFTGDLNIIDEAFAYTPEQQAALAPTALARPHAQTVYLSSPPLTGRTGRVLYKLRARALEGDPRLGLRDWGLEMTLDAFERMSPQERRAFLRDRENWAATLPALGLGRVTEEAVEHLMTQFAEDRDAAREVLCMWPKQLSVDNDWSVIPEADWRDRGGARERPDEDVAFALDASWPDATFGAIAVAGRAGDDLVVQVVEHREGTSWMVPRLLEILARQGRATVVLDKRGPAGHLLAPLEQAGVEVVTPGVSDLARAFGTFLAEVGGDSPRLRHYDQPELDDAVRAAGSRPLGDGRTWARQGDGDISPLTAATAALHGTVEHPAPALPAFEFVNL